MKMEMHTTIKTAITTLLLSGGAAMAENNPPVTCPPGSYESGGQCFAPNPEFNVNNSNTNNIANYNAAVAAAQAAANANATGGNATGGNGYGGKGGAGGAGGKGGQGGAGGKGGNASANATGGAGGKATSNQRQGQRQGQRQSSRNDNRSSASTGPISIDNSNRQRMAANTAATVIPGGYGPANCFGDTNPSGSFGASVQAFGWGASASSQKASNVCAVAALAGPAAALGYLQKMDPNVPRPVVVQQPTGRLICPAHAPNYVEGKGCK